MNGCSQTTLAKVKLEDRKKCSTFVSWQIALQELSKLFSLLYPSSLFAGYRVKVEREGKPFKGIIPRSVTESSP